MKVSYSFGIRFLRGYMLVLTGVWVGLFVLMLPGLLLAAVQEPLITLVGLLIFLLGIPTLYDCLSCSPILELTEDGICSRVLFRKRFYLWSDIIQVGILWKPGLAFCNRLVLLPKGGSPRRYQDKTFVLRNLFRLIWIPQYDAQVLDYIRSHYGPLDFDRTDGCREQSIVAQ